jgi:hypothetical protein
MTYNAVASWLMSTNRAAIVTLCGSEYSHLQVAMRASAHLGSKSLNLRFALLTLPRERRSATRDRLCDGSPAGATNRTAETTFRHPLVGVFDGANHCSGLRGPARRLCLRLGKGPVQAASDRARAGQRAGGFSASRSDWCSRRAPGPGLGSGPQFPARLSCQPTVAVVRVSKVA